MSDNYSIVVSYNNINMLATFEVTLFVTWCNLVDITTIILHVFVKYCFVTLYVSLYY